MPEAKVLIVDDLSMVRVSLKCLISECAPLSVVEVASLEEACSWLAQKENHRDLRAIFCDWKCAGGTILDLMAFVKEGQWSIPIYCLAPEADSALVQEALRQGACGKLEKPFHRAQIQQCRPIFRSDAA